MYVHRLLVCWNNGRFEGEKSRIFLYYNVLCSRARKQTAQLDTHHILILKTKYVTNLWIHMVISRHTLFTLTVLSEWLDCPCDLSKGQGHQLRSKRVAHYNTILGSFCCCNCCCCLLASLSQTSEAHLMLCNVFPTPVHTIFAAALRLRECCLAIILQSVNFLASNSVRKRQRLNVAKVGNHRLRITAKMKNSVV